MPQQHQSLLSWVAAHLCSQCKRVQAYMMPQHSACCVQSCVVSCSSCCDVLDTGIRHNQARRAGVFDCVQPVQPVRSSTLLSSMVDEALHQFLTQKLLLAVQPAEACTGTGNRTLVATCRASDALECPASNSANPACSKADPQGTHLLKCRTSGCHPRRHTGLLIQARKYTAGRHRKACRLAQVHGLAVNRRSATDGAQDKRSMVSAKQQRCISYTRCDSVDVHMCTPAHLSKKQ